MDLGSTNFVNSNPISTSKQTNALEQLTIINNHLVPCIEGEFCINSPSLAGAGSLCRDCRLSPNNTLLELTRHHWKPLGKHKHRVLEREKRDAKYKKAITKRAAEKAKDPTKQARLRAAARAEQKTNDTIIKSTRNSGRVNRDGDHLLHDNIILDTKLQSTSSNPVVHLHELEKVRADARRNGRRFGILCIKNKTGRGIIVIDERDFATLIKK